MASASVGRCAEPFASQAAAQRYVDAELAGEAETMARGDVGLSAQCRIIRETHPKVWAKFERIQEKFVGDDDARWAAHHAAGTAIIMVRLTRAALVAEGKLEPIGERDGQTVYGLSAEMRAQMDKFFLAEMDEKQKSN